MYNAIRAFALYREQSFWKWKWCTSATTSSQASSPTGGGSVAEYGQCGGIGYSGTTSGILRSCVQNFPEPVCVSPCTCVVSNAYIKYTHGTFANRTDLILWAAVQPMLTVLRKLRIRIKVCCLLCNGFLYRLKNEIDRGTSLRHHACQNRTPMKFSAVLEPRGQ